MDPKYQRDDLATIAREIQLLSQEMKQDTFLITINTAEVITKFLRVKAKTTEASFTRVAILDALILNNGALNQTILSKTVYRTKYAISRAIDKLESEGLVKRENQPDSGDKRYRKVFITEKGIKFIKERMHFRRRLAKEATSFLNHDEMYVLGKLLRRLRRHFLNQMSK